MPSIFERYTDAAKRAIFLARLEANHRDADAITPEHILVGLTWESESRFASIAPLKELAVTLRAHMEIPHLPSTSFPYLRDRDIPLNDSGKIALAYAVEEANRDREYWIDCDHLLRALLRFPNGACEALKSVGITLPAIRAAAKVSRQKYPSNQAPTWGYLKIALDRYRLLVWSVALIAILAFFVFLRLRGAV